MIYIVRHGQTVWNKKRMKQGRKDSPLTLKAIEQARNVSSILSKNINNIRDYKIVISPQWRCQQYASFICELLDIDFTDCIVDERLREHSFGMWEGKTEEEIELNFPGFLEKRYQPQNRWTYIVPMGESYELLSKRVSGLVEENKMTKTIYICHEMVSKVMRGIMLNMNTDQILELNHPQNEVYKIHKNSVFTLNEM